MSLFDPETGKLIDPDALRQVQLNPSGRTVPKERVNPDGTKIRQVLHDETGRQTGYQTYHSSGRIDATATPEPVQASFKK